jgi:cystathionine beta-lyase
MEPVNPLTELDLAELRTRRSVKWTTHPPDVLPMFIAEMDTPLPPAVAAALTAAVRIGDTGYATRGRLAEAYAAFANVRFGWWPDPAPMRLVPDVNSGIYEVVSALTERGAGIVVDTPAYPPFFAKLHQASRQIIENPLVDGDNGYEIDVSGLERAFAGGAAAYLLCNPHNPTGTVVDRATLLTIAELADRHGVRMLVDEIHGPLTYPGVEFVPFQTLPVASAQRAISFVSASKAWNLTGLKAALVVPGPDAIEALETMPEEVSFGAGIFGVIAGEVAFTESIAWLDRLRQALDHNRQRLAARLAEEVPQVRYRLPEATYLAWLDFRAMDLGDDPAAAILERGRLALNSGPAFGEPGRGFARLNFATRPDLIDEAVRRIAKAVG